MKRKNAEFSRELLRQNSIPTEGLSEEDRATLERILVRQRARVRRMKWATLILWAVFGLLLTIGAVIERTSPPGPELMLLKGYFAVVLIPLLFLILACMASGIVHAWTLRLRGTDARLIEIGARLARIEREMNRRAEKNDSGA